MTKKESKTNVASQRRKGGKSSISKESRDQKALLLETSQKAFMEIFSALGSTIKLEALLQKILDFTIAECKASQGSVILIDQNTDELDILASKGLPKKIQEDGREKRKNGIAEWVIRNNQPLILNDVVFEERFKSAVEKRDIKSAMCVPLRAKGKVIGTININRNEKDVYFDDNDLNMAVIMASQAAVAIENARLYEENLKTERLAAIGQTLAELAHCIKNIMHAMGGGSYILDAGLNTSDLAKAAKGWDIVKRNNEFLKQLVLDMLSYSKEREPGYSVVDINETCEFACRLFQDMARSKATEIVFEGDPSVGTVAVDKTSIKRCLNNLLRNAVEACGDDGGIVRIATGSNHEKDEFVIRIQDNGCGISEENKPKLFQVFFSTKGSMGTGLGLAVVHKIITEHRGRIEVESEVGKGTTFIITLPKEPPKTK